MQSLRSPHLPRYRSPFLASLAWLVALGCSASGSDAPRPEGVPPDAVVFEPAPELEEGPLAASYQALISEVREAREVTGSELLSEHAVENVSELGYAPREAEFMDRLQASALALNDAELSVLGDKGFVISERQTFPTFLRGYAAIYMEHLPVYVTADAILDALHRGYDDLLLGVENLVLQGELDSLLSEMLQALNASTASDEVKDEARSYLQVALALLRDRAPADASDEVNEWFQQARAAVGMIEAQLFDTRRLIDTSQFTPRGHYTDGLEGYFRAMIWLGRIDLRLMETLPDGQQVFRRSQYEATLALWEAMQGSLARWQRIDDTVRAFVGESDNMIPSQVGELVESLGGIEAARTASDANVIAELAREGYGTQLIASHLMINDGTEPTLPLNRSFLLFGQRYVADSHVFSEVVYDRVPDRMMPDPLDAAFAALGNDQALPLLQDQLTGNDAYAGALSGMRTLIDSHEESFWEANLYNLWSSALRTLSDPAGGSPSDVGLPTVTGTEAWGRRMLNTQLGSWAQLRHDTLLYAKQSYTSIPGCEYPDAYIEPYPEFFAAVRRFAQRGTAMLESLVDQQGNLHTFLETNARQYFTNLDQVAEQLEQMAQQQRIGQPHTSEQLEFINDAVRVETVPDGCVAIEVPDGWYARLFLAPERSIEEDATIADVHTQPADEAGNIVGKVLHVGTGLPRMMTITVDTCAGPRAYAGMAYSYHEVVTEDFQRLTDESWLESLSSSAPPEVRWMSDLIAE